MLREFLSQNSTLLSSKLILSETNSDLFKPIHPAGTLASKLSLSCLVGTVDTATGYQLLSGNNEGEVTEEDRAERRLSLPSVDKIINLNEFETMAQRVLGEDSKAYKFYASVAEDGVGELSLHSSRRATRLLLNYST